MRKILLIILLLCCSTFVFADENIDEIIGLTQEDALTIEAYEAYEDNGTNESLKLFLQAHFYIKNYNYGDAYAALEQALERVEDPKLKGEILYYLGALDHKFEDRPNLIKTGLALKSLSQEENDVLGAIRSNQMLASGYFATYDFEEGKQYAEEALELSMSIGYDIGVWRYYVFMGNILVYEDDSEEALKYFEKAKAYYEEKRLTSIFENIQATSEKNIAYALKHLKKLYESKKYFDLALNYLDEEDYYLRSRIYLMLGWRIGNDRATAIENLEIAFENQKQVLWKVEQDALYYEILEQLGDNYHLDGRYELSSGYFREANKYNDLDETFKALKGAYENLDTYKYEGFQERVKLLEELSSSKDEALKAQKKLFVSIVAATIMAVFLMLIIFVLYRIRKQSKKELYHRSITDELTNTYNRSHILNLLNTKLEGDNAVLLLNLDNFSSINEKFGYHAGDEILKTVADTLRKSVRGKDVLGRYGGKEFLILLEHATQEECRLVAERIRKNIEQCPYEQEDMIVTASIGVTRMYSTNPYEVLKKASDLVVEAKLSGKNQVIYG